MVDLPSGALAAIDRRFQGVALETASFTYALPGTSVREKLLQNIADDVCSGQLGLAFRMHLAAARMHGVPITDVMALLRFVAPYAGYPAAADALGRLGEIVAEVGMEAAVDPDPALDPVPGGRPEQSDVAFLSPDSWMSAFLASRTARAWSEERLTPRERAIVAITTDVGLQTLGESFRTHVRLLLRCGALADHVRDVVRFTAELGLAGSTAAMAELECVLQEAAAREERHQGG